MAASLYENYNDHDIDPNSTLLIRICIRSIAQSRVQAVGSLAEGADAQGLVTRSEEPLSGHTAARGKAKKQHGDMTQDRVMSMSPDELVSLHKRVQQLELSNYGMLRRIYGDQVSAGPYVHFNGHDPASTPKTDAYRNRLFEHYQTMMEVARDPEMPDLQPASPDGARLLKTFQDCLAHITTSGERISHHSRKNSAHEHKLHSPQRSSPTLWKVDKKAVQAHRARLDQFKSGTRGQSTALTDYQLQLMLLEEQNQERLAIMQIQRQANTPPVFDPILYQAQLAALKVQNYRRLELQDAAQSEAIPAEANTDESMKSDFAMSESESPTTEVADRWRMRDKVVQLPTRDKDHAALRP
jgi:hypothetical protein